MAVGPRKRFEVFKRDDFQCRYCGRKTPEVVLEVDHIVPVCEGGSDDEINLATSCWECNSGKSGVPLNQVMTGEDPHDRAVMLMEQERQLREYSFVLAQKRERIEREADELMDYWCEARNDENYWKADRYWVMRELERTSVEDLRRAVNIALANGKTKNMGYAAAIVRNWREEGRI